MPNASSLFSPLKEYFHKYYSLGICGWLYQTILILSTLWKQFGRLNAIFFKKGKIHLKVQNQIQILGWTYGQKDFHLSLDMNIQNMPGEPSNNPQVSPISESLTLLTSDLDNFGL